MREFPLTMDRRLIVVLALFLAGLGSPATYGQKPHVTKVKPTKTPDTTQTAEPDKVLYDRAMADLKHTKYTEARLDLQTLINTYPDSEYLAKAKLGIADSFYKEGGTSNLTQAVDEYKNFIVFFPFLDEAAYAQMQVAMCHYRMMEKADRDNSQAQSAEDEFRTFLLKFPQSPLLPRAEQDLRNVQEVLADGEYRIAHFYYVKQDYRASAARLVELTGRYPLYSQSDVALWMLGNIYQRAKQASKNEDDKNHWGDLAAQCYNRIVKDYPLSKLAPDAKAHLTAMGMPVPKADPEALARMQKQQLFEKEHHPNPVTATTVGMVKANPDVHLAAQVGQPNLNPPDDSVSATEVLSQGAAGPRFNLAAGVASSRSDSASSDTESVESSSPDTSTASAGAQIIAAPTTAAAADPAAQPAPSTMTSLPTAPTTAPQAVSENSAAPASAAVNSPTPPPGSSQAVATPPASGGSNPSSAQSSSQSANNQDDSKNESSSKKKKGLHKLIP
ncbi:MAG TPA: outer membrane protein assembly factor BamD [Candidatus Acidoferrales bacterium]|nr:outer membrane protein assembly factor BamD [Candidatus Acidoferrales bacterium]